MDLIRVHVYNDDELFRCQGCPLHQHKMLDEVAMLQECTVKPIKREYASCKGMRRRSVFVHAVW